VSVQLIFGNTLAPVKLFDATPNLGVDRGFAFQQPAILFFLCLEQSEQGFLGARCSRRLNLLLDSSFQGPIVDFYVHGRFLDIPSLRLSDISR
jgi:hypothetical protein